MEIINTAYTRKGVDVATRREEVEQRSEELREELAQKQSELDAVDLELAVYRAADIVQQYEDSGGVPTPEVVDAVSGLYGDFLFLHGSGNVFEYPRAFSLEGRDLDIVNKLRDIYTMSKDYMVVGEGDMMVLHAYRGVTSTPSPERLMEILSDMPEGFPRTVEIVLSSDDVVVVDAPPKSKSESADNLEVSYGFLHHYEDLCALDRESILPHTGTMEDAMEFADEAEENATPLGY